MFSRKKLCGDAACRRKGELLSLQEFPKHRHRPDGRNNYCRECAVRKVREYRERQRAKKKADQIFRATIQMRHRLQVVKSIENAIAEGKQTREQIHRSTNLDYDTLGQVLAELVWETKSLKIQRVGNQRVFVAAA